MSTSLNWSFSKIPLVIGGSHTQNSRCFPFTNLLETFGNIQTDKSYFYTDYQHYTEYKNTQGMNLLMRSSRLPRMEPYLPTRNAHAQKHEH